MATLRIIVKANQQRKDDSFPISIRLTHKRVVAYMFTGHYAVKSQLTKSFEIKDTRLLSILINRQNTYKEIIENLGLDADNYSARELADYVIAKSKPNKGLDADFIELALEYADNAQRNGRRGSAANYRCAINALKDFRNNECTTIKNLSFKVLTNFVAHLKTERVITRPNQLGRTTTTTNKPLSDVAVSNYIRDIKTLYNAVVNDMDEEMANEALIKYNPFRKFKVAQVKSTSSQRTITVEEMRKIFSSKLPEDADRRTTLGFDVYKLSFLLVGINSVDLWQLPITAYQNGRITYNRAKTRDRRSDDALISIKIEPEAVELIEKYRAIGSDRFLNFAEHYSTAQNFNKAINIGLVKVAEHLGIESRLTLYTARHSWATIARNKCRISKDDVHLALNHVDRQLSITDAYIERCWDLIDEANRKVVDFVHIE